MAQPLRGLRVLDLTRVLAGPYASMILGDLGAEIIKIERPLVGDDTRRWGPPFKGEESVYFLSVNRNKRSVGIDFKRPRGAKLLQRLAAKSDIFIENYLPGKLATVGLDYTTIRKLHPSIIYCSLTGFGQTGPWASRAGYDVSAAAVGGLLGITGPPDGPPCRVGVAVTDLSTGLYSVIGILAALRQRDASGSGCQVDANLLSSQIATMSMAGANFLTAGSESRRWGTGHPSIVPYQAFLTADNCWLLIGAGNDDQFVDLCSALGLSKLAEDERFRRNADRVRRREEVVDLLQGRIAEKSKEEWLRRFEEGVKFAFSPVNSVGEAFSLEQVKHNGLIQSLEHSREGAIRVPGPALRFSPDGEQWKSFSETATAPPVLGEDTEAVLTEVLGLPDAEVSELQSEGVIS